MEKREVNPSQPERVDMATPTPPGISNINPRPISPPDNPEPTRQTPQGTKINSTAMLGIIIFSTLCSLLGYFIHYQGHGDASSASKAKYLLGVDIEADKLHVCGVNCYFVGPYRVTLDIDKPFMPKERLDILPWYLELSPGSKKDTLIATLPRKVPTLPTKRPNNILPLAGNLTPISILAEEVDTVRGQVKFLDGSIFQAKDRSELEHYDRGSRWVLIRNPLNHLEVVEGIPIWHLELTQYERGYIGWDLVSPKPAPYMKPQEPW